MPFFERAAALLSNAGHLPPKGGKCVRLKRLDFLDTQLNAGAVEDDGELIVADETQAKRVAVELLRPLWLGARKEGGKLCGPEHVRLVSAPVQCVSRQAIRFSLEPCARSVTVADRRGHDGFKRDANARDAAIYCFSLHPLRC